MTFSCGVQPEFVQLKRKKTSNLLLPFQRRVLLRGCALDLRLPHPQVNSRGPSLSYAHALTSLK